MHGDARPITGAYMLLVDTAIPLPLQSCCPSTAITASHPPASTPAEQRPQDAAQ